MNFKEDFIGFDGDADAISVEEYILEMEILNENFDFDKAEVLTKEEVFKNIVESFRLPYSKSFINYHISFIKKWISL